MNSDKNTTKSSEQPAPEELHAPGESDSSASQLSQQKVRTQVRRGSYRPSHKATFIGLAVIVLILGINAAVILFVINSAQKDSSDSALEEVTLSNATLEGLGVSRNPVGDLGTELIVGPNSQFKGTVTVSSDVSIAGQLKLNSKFSATDASLARLEAGDTSLTQLNVNGDATASNINLRQDLTVLGAARIQGPLTLSQLLTVNNNVNITGSLAVGGTLSSRTFQAGSLVSDSTLTIGGHIITRGSAPSVSTGGGIGSNGTVSISGNDASGTVAVNVGVGGGNGTLVFVAFRTAYNSTPHVVVTPVGQPVGSFYVNRTATGFSIAVGNGLSPGGYAFDYIVMQ